MQSSQESRITDKPDAFTPAEDPISGALRDLLAVFADALGDVKFPDVDARALGTQAKQIEERFGEVRRAEAALVEARRKLGEAQDGLLQRAQRALAYARVFADGDPTLTARLDAIALPRARAARSATVPATDDAPKKRGRPRKVPAPGTTLFAGDDDRSPAPRAPML